MKMHTVSLSLLALCLIAVPAMAQQQQTIYDNGPVNGQVSARTINFGFAVTDSFYNGNGLLYSSGVSFWVWLFPGDTLTSVEVSFGSHPYGTDIYDGYFNPQLANCFYNRFGYNVCQATVEFYSSPYGNAWMTLQNADVPSGNPVLWDLNSGVGCMSQGCPSHALQKEDGGVLPTAGVPSESFTIVGYQIVGNQHAR